jgi:hypothetical protein
VAGGYGSVASGHFSTVVGGSSNTAAGDYAVAGGQDSLASGDNSVALGRRARAVHPGSFVWADTSDFDFASASSDSFRVRATGGGVRFVVALNPDGSISTNCLLNSVSGGWNCSSDRNLKNIVRKLDGKAVLDKLATMPIFEWSPKAAPAPVRHFGPTAQDFRAVFGLGDSDLHIGAQDADGVALAAIQGLYSELRERDATIAELHGRLTQIESLRDDLIALRAALGEALGARALLARQETTRREAR